MREQVPVVGVWDDHDYGPNDGGKEFKDKHVYRNMYMKFIEERENTTRFKEGSKGIY